MAQIRIFISHSSRDAELAHALVNLIRSAVHIPANQVRCTSVEGHRLEGGAETDDELRQEIVAAEVFLGLVSALSIESAYVLFEMGARWGSARRLIPILAPGADSNHLRGPLAGLHALRCDSEQQLHQLVAQIATALGLPPESPAVYLDELRAVQQSKPSPATPDGNTPPPVAVELTEEHETLLRLFAEAEWKMARANRIAELLGWNRTRTGYLLDQLRECRLVNVSATSTGAAYSLSKGGRAHAVKKGYC